MAEQSLKDKTVKGTIWSGIDNVARYAVSFVVGIILARLLSPEDYGLIGIIAIFTTVCDALIEGGMGAALLRKKNTTEEDYNTVFILNLCASIVLYAVIFFSAPAIANFFGRVELVALTRVSSLSMILGGLSLVQKMRLTKQIDFKTQTKITLVSATTSGVLGIVMAFLGLGVWALVIQSLSNQVLSTALLWFFNKWIPNFHFYKSNFTELFGFGWKMMVVVLMNSIWKELYQVVVGKFYSPASLGQYTRAKTFSDLFSSNLTNVVQRVTFPVLSSIQDDKERMIAAYRRIIKTTMFITAVAMFALGAVSEPLLYCLIGPKWHEAATYLPLICIAGSLYPLHAINLNMLQIQGRSDLFLYIEIIKKVIGLVPIFVGAFVGIMPMLIANIFAGIISFFLNSFFTGRFLGYDSWMQIKDVLPSYGVALVVAASVWFLKFLPISNWLILSVQVFVGASVFFVVCRMIKLEEFEEAKNMLMPFINKFRR